jgi:hypothetical protein
MKYPARRRSGALLSGLLVLAALAPALALPGTYAPQTARDVRFAGGGSSVTLPFEEDDGHIVLRGTIGGSAPLWLILDTGATGSLIDSRQARALGLPFGESFQVIGAAGAVDAWEVESASIGLPGLGACPRKARSSSGASRRMRMCESSTQNASAASMQDVRPALHVLRRERLHRARLRPAGRRARGNGHATTSVMPPTCSWQRFSWQRFARVSDV